MNTGFTPELVLVLVRFHPLVRVLIIGLSQGLSREKRNLSER